MCDDIYERKKGAAWWRACVFVRSLAFLHASRWLMRCLSMQALSEGGGVGACPLTMGDAPVFTMTRSTVEHCVAASSGGISVGGSVTNIRDSVVRAGSCAWRVVGGCEG